MKDHSFTIVVDDFPVEVISVPFQFNAQTRYRVSYNNSPEVIFTWDLSVGRFVPISDEASTMPDNIELAIAQKLSSIKI
jgi:hypothetical protein